MINRFDEATLKQISIPSRRSDVVYDAIRNAILYRRIKRGEWLREAMLADELGVSRTMVRDALTRLVSEGLAVDVPYRGVQAASVSAAELEEVYAIRAKLEAWAFELAAVQLTSEELAKMRELLPQAALDPTLQSLDKTREVHREFHWIAIRSTKKRHLMRLLEQIWDMMPAYVIYPELTFEQRQEIANIEKRDHAQIVEALEKQNGRRAAELIGPHVMNTFAYVAPILEKSVDKEEALVGV